MLKPLHLLIIEDHDDDLLLLLRELKQGGYTITYDRIQTAEELTAALPTATWEAVLSDFSLPGFGAQAALMMLSNYGLDLPFIILSGTVGEQNVVAALKAGAHDFIPKTEFARLLPALERELREAATRREHRRAEAHARQLEAQRRHLVELSHSLLNAVSLDEIFRVTIHTLEKNIPCQRSGVYWLDETTTQLHLMALPSVAPLPDLQHWPIALGQGIVGYVAQTGVAELINNAEADARSIYPSNRRPSVEHLMVLPLRAQNKVVGVLMLGRFEDPPFTPADFELTTIFVSHATLAVEKTILLTRTQESERHYRLLADNATDLITRFTPEAQCVYVSPSCQTLLGYPPDDFRQHFLGEILPDDDLVRLQEAYLVHGRANSVFTITHRLRHRLGATLWVESVVRLFRNEHGEVIEIQASTRDITARKRAEDEIRLLQTLTLAASIAPNMAEALQVVLHKVCEVTQWPVGQAWLPNAEGTRLECGPAWCQSEHYLVFRQYSQAMTFERGQGLVGMVWATHQPVWSSGLTMLANLPRGEIIRQVGLNAILVAPVLVGEQVVAVIEFLTPAVNAIDERRVQLVTAVGQQLGQVLQSKQAEDSVRRLNAELEQRVADRTMSLEATNAELARSNADLEQFAYSASHDLQEPLRAITLYTQLLAKRYRGRLDADADEFIAYAVEGAMRMQALIKGLLDYSRVGKIEALTLTDCNAALALATANLQLALEDSAGQVLAEPLPMVMGNTLRLSQVFQNLIGNALKFRGEHPPQIRIAAYARERVRSSATAVYKHEWVFTVQDNGIGIAAEHYDQIFNIFTRLHTREEYPGAGIGLATCKKIIERLNGHMWVESQVGVGTTFYFTLPKVEPSPSGG